MGCWACRTTNCMIMGRGLPGSRCRPHCSGHPCWAPWRGGGTRGRRRAVSGAAHTNTITSAIRSRRSLRDPAGRTSFSLHRQSGAACLPSHLDDAREWLLHGGAEDGELGVALEEVLDLATGVRQAQVGEQRRRHVRQVKK